MARVPTIALTALLAAMPAAAQVCAGYPMLTGSFAFSAATARETATDARDYAVSTRWQIRESLALETSSGVSSLTGMHASRASTGLVYELPVKRFSACAFAGLEYRYTWFDAETAALLSGFNGAPFSSEWYLPVGLAFGYNRPISQDVSIFAYTQPHVLLWRAGTGSMLMPMRSRPGESLLKGSFALRSGAGVRAGQLLIGVENTFTNAPNGSTSSLRLRYLGAKPQTTTARVPQ